MKTRRMIPLLICSLLLFGCVFSEDERLPQGSYDIVFQTEKEGNETLGFYSLSSKESRTLVSTKNLASPYILQEEYLGAITKITEYGDPRGAVGNITLLRKSTNGLFCKDNDFFTDLIRPYGDKFAFYREGVINLINPDECKIQEKLLDLRDVGLYPLQNNIQAFSVDPGSGLMILSMKKQAGKEPETFNMVRINLKTKEVFDYKKFGINPSISPDGNEVAYFSQDGIRIMDINGNDKVKVTDDIPWMPGDEWSYDYVWPKPEWSPDGGQLIYHKCPGFKEPHYLCDKYEKYNVYLYDILSEVESQLFGSGVNPSWINH